MSSGIAHFAPEAVAAIHDRLSRARADGAVILFAIESGSRAWGFPSPDSDYDCRFVYVRTTQDHLVLQQPRDVIEFPIEGDIDVGGWDLRKALLLALAGNAVIVEWTASTMAYEEVPAFRSRLTPLLEQIVDPAKVARHYHGLARSQLSKMGSLAEDVKLKKAFYFIRPIVALDWMEQRGFASLPPMHLPLCLEQTDVPAAAAREIRRLIDRKSRTRELGTGPLPAPIASYLESRYGHHEMNMPKSTKDDARCLADRALAESFYREVATAA